MARGAAASASLRRLPHWLRLHVCLLIPEPLHRREILLTLGARRLDLHDDALEEGVPRKHEAEHAEVLIRKATYILNALADAIE